jgi:hypothetical protein
MVVSPAGLGTEKSYAGETSSNCKLETSPLFREDDPMLTNPQHSHNNKSVVMGPRWAPNTEADRPTDRGS